MLQSIAAAYLQTATMALASLFGSGAVQSVLSGQAAVAVAVSLVQVVSTAGSVKAASGKPLPPADAPLPGPPSHHPPHWGRPTEWGAFAFFGLASLFMITSFGAQVYITRSRRYRAIISASKQEGEEELPEREGLLSSVSSLNSYDSDQRPREKIGATEMLRLNKTYNFSVAFIFVVTLVSSSSADSTLLLTSAHKGCLPTYYNTNHFCAYTTGTGRKF